MCGDKLCPSCEYERIRRKDLRDKIKNLVLCLNQDGRKEEFVSMKEELLSLVDKID